MILHWITILVLLQGSLVEGRCDLSDDELNLGGRHGSIKSANYPYYISAPQTCDWIFPEHEYPGEGLFIYIREVNFIVDLDAVADLVIGDESPFYKKPRANCRLYGVNISDVDLKSVIEFLTLKYESQGLSCDEWNIETRMVERMTFRSFDREVSVFRDRKFSLVYEYISTKKKVPITSQSAEPPRFSMQLTSTTSGHQEANCGSSQPYMIGFIVAGSLFAVTLISLIYVIFRQRKVDAETCISPGRSGADQEHINATYSSITVSSSRTPVAEYDVPTNNRVRAPTAASGSSVLSEQHYQVPSPQRAIQEEPEDQSYQTEVKDVYAVVNKERSSEIV